ncbi:MAG: phosphopantetheine-binding protein [Burkholderiaceae bacterium]
MNTQRSTLQSELIELIAGIVKIDPQHVEPGARLIDIGVKSLDMVEVIFTIEERYGISIPYNANETVADTVDALLEAVIDLIEALGAGQADADAVATGA